MPEHAGKITLAAALEYLRQHDWRTEREGHYILCRGQQDDYGNHVFRYLPASENDPEFTLRIEDLVRTLSAVLNRPISVIIAEMAALPDVPLAAADGQPSNGISPRIAPIIQDILQAANLIGREQVRKVAADLAPILEAAVVAIDNDEERMMSRLRCSATTCLCRPRPMLTQIMDGFRAYFTGLESTGRSQRGGGCPQDGGAASFPPILHETALDSMALRPSSRRRSDAEGQWVSARAGCSRLMDEARHSRQEAL